MYKTVVGVGVGVNLYLQIKIGWVQLTPPIPMSRYGHFQDFNLVLMGEVNYLPIQQFPKECDSKILFLGLFITYLRV